MKRLCMLLMLLLAMTLQSHRVFAQSVTITLTPGWNWISVPTMDTLDFETALGSFTPAVGDMIKSQWSNASYRADGHWRGQISQFYPGYGYKYYSNRTMPVTLTFNAQQPAPQVIVTTAEPTDITTNSAICGGTVTSSSGDYVFVFLRGICWSTNPNPTFNDNYIETGNGLGSFTVSMAELTLGTAYYVRAFAVTPNGTFYGDEISFHTQTWSNGILPGAFSVSANQQVYFSQGNLQYQASTNTWRFADNQWDYVGTQNPYYGNPGGTITGSDNSNISSTYSGWIDLFGWGTSGYNHGANCYQPWSTITNSSNYYAYGNYLYNLYDQTGQADWGYNPISNGGNQTNQWRTLTQPEWSYVFHTRTTTSGIRYAKANVNNVILLPDDWRTNTNSSEASFSRNTLTASQWSTLEQAGAVFLPAAGGRSGTSVYDVGSNGYYWSASYYNNYLALNVYFNGSYLYFYSNNYFNRFLGFSVRLVRVAE